MSWLQTCRLQITFKSLFLIFQNVIQKKVLHKIRLDYQLPNNLKLRPFFKGKSVSLCQKPKKKKDTHTHTLCYVKTWHGHNALLVPICFYIYYKPIYKQYIYIYSYICNFIRNMTNLSHYFDHNFNPNTKPDIEPPKNSKV